MSSSAQNNRNQQHQPEQVVASSSDSDSTNIVPAAPYPPMQFSSLRSSLSSNPLYGPRFLTTTTPAITTIGEGTDAILTVDTSNTSSAAASTPQHQHQQQTPTSVSNQNYNKSFVAIRSSPVNVGLYASLNMHEEDLRTRSKVGPRLCDIYQLKERRSTADHSEHQAWQFWESHSVGVSRANPQLGPSITSTCLDWSPTNPFQLATGLNTGNLCIHSLKKSTYKNNDEALSFSITNEQFSFGRNKRPATSVAWRSGSNNNHVALGLSMMSSTAQHLKHSHHRKSRTSTEFGCLLWDIEHQQSSSSSQSISKTTSGGSNPFLKVCHNAGVSSMAWCSPITLAIGCQIVRHLQLYDLRVSASSSTPITIRNAHREGAVQIIRVDNDYDGNSHLLATMGLSDPVVKLWDMRKIDSLVTSDVSSSENSQSLLDYKTNPSTLAEFEMEYPPTTIEWSQPGVLSVAIRNRVIHFDTKTSNKQPLQLGQSYSCAGSDDILDMAMVPNEDRFLVTLRDKKVYDLSKHTTTPLAISQRDDHIVHGFRGKMWTSSTTSVKCDFTKHDDYDDISTIMKQRACQKNNQGQYYSMDPLVNMEILTGNTSISYNNNIMQGLVQTWKWVARMEFENILNLPPSRALIEGGIWQLLGMQIRSIDQQQTSTPSEVGVSSPIDEDLITIEGDCLSINMYDSPSRRCALLACGWKTQSGNAYKGATSNDKDEEKEKGKYERAAALAVWHDNIGVAVDILQQGAQQKSNNDTNQLLQLVAICIAGYDGSNAAIWQQACSNILDQTTKVNNTSSDYESCTNIAYLRALLRFLLLTRKEEVDSSKSDCGLKSVLEDPHLSLSDRVAFACRFLSPIDLKTQLQQWTDACQENGAVEGLIISGLTAQGIQLLQSFVDKTGDVQTATLITSRVAMEIYSKDERRVCSEWLDSYRNLLNHWQMWQARAMFDVDRADLMRAFTSSQASARQQQYNKSNKLTTEKKKNQKVLEPDFILSSLIPAQMEARCNYCSVSLSGVSRRQQDGISSNEWLSRSKNVLSCCPKCRKPLPRCSICLLSLGCLNPYAEFKKTPACHIASNSVSNRGGGGQFNKNNDFVSSLANLPFAEWFTWCMKCKHGGHAHCLVEWFSDHNTCPVSGCDCQCQFDANILNH